jgi:hypothetical protein
MNLRALRTFGWLAAKRGSHYEADHDTERQPDTNIAS